jgi:hypothetical protein
MKCHFKSSRQELQTGVEENGEDPLDVPNDRFGQEDVNAVLGAGGIIPGDFGQRAGNLI